MKYKLTALLLASAFIAGAMTSSPSRSTDPLPNVYMLTNEIDSGQRVPSNREYAEKQEYDSFMVAIYEQTGE